MAGTCASPPHIGTPSANGSDPFGKPTISFRLIQAIRLLRRMRRSRFSPDRHPFYAFHDVDVFDDIDDSAYEKRYQEVADGLWLVRKRQNQAALEHVKRVLHPVI